MLCSNELHISEQIIVSSLDKTTGLLSFQLHDRVLLRDVIQNHPFVASVFDLNHLDESILEVIGYVQKANPSCPLICVSNRQRATHTGTSTGGTFSFVHPQIPTFVLRKLLQRPRQQEAPRFQGAFQAGSLYEVIQLLLCGGLSGRLTVWNGWGRGELWVHRAYIVHADSGGRLDEEALLGMLDWQRGTFRFQFGRPAPHIQSMKLGLHHHLFDPPADNHFELAEWEDEPVGALALRTDAEPPGSTASPDPEPELPQAVPPLLPSALSQLSPPPALDPGGAGDGFPPERPAAEVAPLPRLAAVLDDTPEEAAAAEPAPTEPPATVAELTSIEQSEPLAALPPPAPHPAEIPEQSATPVPAQSAAQDWEPGLQKDIESTWRQVDVAKFLELHQEEGTMAVTSNSVKDTLSKLELTVEGFIGAAVADSDSGMCIGWTGGAGVMNIEVAAAANTEVVRSKRKAMKSLNLRDEIEDILITLGKQYHLIRPLRTRSALFIYLAVDRTRANLAMARFALLEAERDLAA